jgi:long-subunit fatty acid transport protein
LFIDKYADAVVRGGNYQDPANQVRSTARMAADPIWNRRDPQVPKSIWWNADAPFVGFRIMRPAKQPSTAEINSFFEKYDADVEKDFVFFQRLMDQFYAKWHFVHYQLNHRVNLQKDIPLIDKDGNYGHAELSGKANGYGFNAGVYFQPIEKLSIGLTYRSKVNMEVKDGDATFNVPESVTASFPNGKFTSKLPLPSVLTLGLAYKINQKFNVALDINYVGWKAYDTLAFDYESNTTSLIDTKSARMYKNTFAFRAGAQYKIDSHFAARIGLAYGITPVQNGYVTPETPDANRVNYTAGIGYEFGKHFKIDVSFLFTHLKRKDTNIETNLSGTFKTNVIAPGISIGYKF